MGGEGGEGVLVTAWSVLALLPDLDSVPDPDVGSAGDTARCDAVAEPALPALPLLLALTAGAATSVFRNSRQSSAFCCGCQREQHRRFETWSVQW